MMKYYLYSNRVLFKKWQRNLWHINSYHGNAQLIFALPSQNYKWKAAYDQRSKVQTFVAAYDQIAGSSPYHTRSMAPSPTIFFFRRVI
jgi:hypothetical protein